MIEILPSFMKSKYYKAKPYSRMEDGASDEEKRQFEEFHNTESFLKILKKDYPNMKNPYMSWRGKIEDRG